MTSANAGGIVSTSLTRADWGMPRFARRYTAKLKFQVVLEALKGEKTPGQIAKAYGVHANSVGIWKHWFLERGPGMFERTETIRDEAKRIAELEQLLGKKEVELALLRNFLGQTA